MCGICFCVHSEDGISEDDKLLEKLICNRGPDAFNKFEVELNSNWKARFYGSTLWTQGCKPRNQPVVREDGSIFLWNGDVYSGIGNGDNLCDTDEILSLIENEGIEALTNISGPYSFVYFIPTENKIWIGRDAIGRHSLIWKLTTNSLFVSSVASKFSDVDEVPSCGLFMVEILENCLRLTLHPWSHLNLKLYENLSFDIQFDIKQSFCHKLLGRCEKHDWIGTLPQEIYSRHLKVFKENSSFNIIFPQLLQDELLFNTVEHLKVLLFNSVHKRIKTQPKYCKDCLVTRQECLHSKTSICFSGGLDSTVIALIADRFVPKTESIDLFNIAFERPSSKDSGFDVPDRVNGHKSFEELKILTPLRKWNFIEINVTLKELNDKRENHISHLIHPLDSILDESLGCALWFAVRGQGTLNGYPYSSKARIVLLGMGADELFGGYSRHRKEFSTSGWQSLGEQLLLEVRNIGRRNLGRDNRVAADHGRQPRLPFLDENVYAYVDSLPPWFRCYPTSNLQPGIGDKFLLRLVAWDIGLRFAASLPKKALQFGSRIANPKEKGHHTSHRLK